MKEKLQKIILKLQQLVLLKFQSPKERNPKSNYNFKRQSWNQNFLLRGEKNYAGKFPLLLPPINQNLCFVTQELCKSFLLLHVLNLLAAVPRKREWVSNPNLCRCKFLSVSTFATLSFINSSHMLFLSGKGMFFGTDQP